MSGRHHTATQIGAHAYPPVPRADALSLADLARGAPLHVPGLVAHWPAIERWSPEYLRARAGDASFVVETYPEGTPYGRVTSRRLPLSEFLAAIESTTSGRAPFLAETNRSLDRNAPALAADIPVPEVLAAISRRTAALFLGRDSTTHLHFHHVDDALLCQVLGRKRVVLFPPRETHRLHPYPVRSRRWMWSRVDIEAPDLELHRRFSQARGVECTLSPGDALYIPLHWWHAALSTGTSGSVTWFWPSSRRRDHPAMAMRAAAGSWLARMRDRWSRVRTSR